tara:strand:- start:261 stop:416 length:156 start_codon:yes stop_codon:yes gene_type:complete
VDDYERLEPKASNKKTFHRGAFHPGDTVRDQDAGDFRLVRPGAEGSRGVAT